MTEHPIPDRVRKWSQRLLDFSLRNRLLNVRDSRELLPLADDDPEVVENRLAASSAVRVNSALNPEDTAKRLLHLYRIARTDIEEGGANTLFLAVGFLEWKSDADAVHVAPLLLLPVKLTRKSVGEFVLSRLDDDTVVNPTLLEFLRAEFGMSVEGVSPLPADESGVDVAAVFDAFERAVSFHADWRVRRKVALGRFSFAKFVMWKDLTSRLDALRRNPLIAHLIDGDGCFDDGVDVFPPEDISAHLDPADLYCPLAADSSQLTAVLYARMGKTFVLHGPPGTGKSQTITNLIADNLAHGRRVLFVSEKKAALDVVHSRLEKIGLNPFCLELHSNKSGKAEVLAQFADALDSRIEAEDPEKAAVASSLNAERDKLNAYVKALHRVYPCGLAAYQAFARMIAAGDRNESGFASVDALKVTREQLEALRDAVRQVAVTMNAVSADDRKSLSDVLANDWSPQFERDLSAAAESLLAASTRGWFSRLWTAWRNRRRFRFGAARRYSSERCEQIRSAIPSLRNFMRFRSAAMALSDLGLSAFLQRLETVGLTSPEVACRMFDDGFAARMVEQLLSNEPVLATFNGLDRDARIRRFRELDAKLGLLAKQAAFARITDRLPLDLSGHPGKGHRLSAIGREVAILRRECEKRARHKPIRQLLSEIPELAALLKPCFLMSPLSVAQYLPPDIPPFDLVVFDEASQIPVWDAVGVIARGSQLIVVGDPKQMPPTNFFLKNQGGDVEPETVEDLESILDECLAVGVGSSYLSWHYRSRHESLIAFSNHEYYDGRLYTFPSASQSPKLGVGMVFVQNGTYDRTASRTNRLEAESVVDWIFANCGDGRSVGVVTFSMAQRDLIDDLIEKRRLEDKALEAFFSDDAEDPFFVKNLENVQGDERDVILFSVGYAPDANGAFAMNFGPLNRSGGERRLNVAITRAREQVVVFSSIHGSQIDLSRTSSTGAAHLRAFLEFAECGGKLNHDESGSSDEFASEVARFIRAHGFEVAECLGDGLCRIDLAVRTANSPAWQWAVECDGPSYASQLTTRDRDEVRPGMLESLGWKTVRLWSVDWTLDRKRAETELLNRLK